MRQTNVNNKTKLYQCRQNWILYCKLHIKVDLPNGPGRHDLGRGSQHGPNWLFGASGQLSLDVFSLIHSIRTIMYWYLSIGSYVRDNVYHSYLYYLKKWCPMFFNITFVVVYNITNILDMCLYIYMGVYLINIVLVRWQTHTHTNW